MTEKVDNKKIAKNTIILYIRMIVTMVVSIYSSRIILEYLGITDYGIYQSVGGIVGMIAFTNTAISTGISRFITYGLGEDNPGKLRNLFSTIFTTQICFILFIVLIAETFGLWFVTHKLIIPEASKNAAIFTYHLSVLTFAISMLANPFIAMITAHERFNIYAYISLITTFATLGAAYLLMFIPTGRLYLYSSLLFLINAFNLIFQIAYSYKHFSETTLRLSFNRSMFKEIAGFSGWSLFAAFSIALNNQGILILLNMFFSPAVVAARAVSLTVNGAANNLVSNIRTAMNPQIVKQFAAGNHSTSKDLLLSSTKMSFYLMLLFSVPIFYMAGPLLSIWLKEVPQYSEIFLKLVIIQSLFQVFDTSFYTALYAKGQLRENALISPTLGFIGFPITYLLFKMGASPIAFSWVALVSYAILGLIIKPILLIKIVNYNWKEIRRIIFQCSGIAILAFIIGFLVTKFFYRPNFGGFIINSALCVLTTTFIVYLVGLSTEMRKTINLKLRVLILKKI